MVGIKYILLNEIRNNFFLLYIFFTVTIGCLILQQNYHRRNILTSYPNLINNTENSYNDDSEGQVVDVEDLISSTSNTAM